ncbi:MAG TPA: hypothetical protein VGV37_06365 [Aliidongia sp.]|uniref:hypothetical protein n=1 Tax=Aliidongia sp. TaxID=1914230 RepID=UPI002DDD7D28|nr:hypothetical protein [Aliidongia sp.]HEV2674149.1 hypothetical protein [Aliidongia sp.]
MKKLLSLALAGLLLVAGGAFAQQIPVPQVQSLGSTDLVPVIPGGQPQAATYYATAGQVAGVFAYSIQAPLTAFTITDGNGVSFLFLNPAGTLATGTLTMMAVPSDGQNFCLESTQTQTAITISANTGQSLGGTLATPTALVANTRYCWLYSRSAATWYRYA